MKPITPNSTRPLPGEPATPEVLSQEIWVSGTILLAPGFATLDAFSDWLECDLALLEARHQTYCTRNSLRPSLTRGR